MLHCCAELDTAYVYLPVTKLLLPVDSTYTPLEIYVQQ